jgi:hypothetical protein
MKRGMIAMRNSFLIASALSINLYGTSDNWAKIDLLEKSGKFEEAKKLKAQTIEDIQKLYVSQFPKEELALRALERISKLQPQIQEMLFQYFDIGIEKINDQKTQRQYTIRITAFFEGVNKNSGGSEEYAKKNLETLPGFAQSELYQILLGFARRSDKIFDPELQEARNGLEEARNGLEEARNGLEEARKRNELWKKLLGTLNSLSKPK